MSLYQKVSVYQKVVVIPKKLVIIPKGGLRHYTKVIVSLYQRVCQSTVLIVKVRAFERQGIAKEVRG